MTTTARWLASAAVYGCLMLAIAFTPLPGGALLGGVLLIWFALGFTLRSYSAIVLVFVVPIWGAIRGTTSGDMGADWPLELLVAVPAGALFVAAGVWAGRLREANTPNG